MLITFEGIDGSGKSTQARLLVKYLREEGYPAVLVREPGGTELSEHVRSLLLNPDLEIVPFAELLLFSAARAQLVTERIRPALDEGKIVVCDRFYDSSTAYQGGGRELRDLEWLQQFHEKVTGGLIPDRTYLVELSPEQARARLQEANGAVPDRMEGAEAAFHERVAAAYARLAEAEPDRFRRLDGRQSIEVLQQHIRADVRHLLAERHGTPKSGNGSPD